MNEFKLINALKTKIPRSLQGIIPIGDDAGALTVPRNKTMLFAADAVVDGVDFHASKIRPENAGRKALAINLSDIAAMGGQPLSCVISLGIPKDFPEIWVKRFYSGLIKLAKEYKVQIAGGDISRAKEFFASIAMAGCADKKEIIQRSGARPGDILFVTGKLGGSILGHHYDFIPRVAEGRFLAAQFKPNAMMDISDGLWQDLEHLCGASKAGVRIDLDKIPVSKDARKLAKGNPCKAIERALTDGEDFELLFALPKAKADILEKKWKQKFPKVSLSRIGSIVSGRGIAWFWEGEKTAMKKNIKKGFQHF